MKTVFLLMAPDEAQARVWQLFDLDSETGILVWKIRPASDFQSTRICNIWNTKYAGKVAGSVYKNGYRMASIDGRPYYEHRLIWLHHYGVWPDEIDHIDHVKTNNAISNLRDVGRSENARNRGKPANNSSGSVGVRWDARRGKWSANIKVGGKVSFLGYFPDFDGAVQARKEAEAKLDFHSNHGART